ncbi:MAG: hypothetical protein WD398_09895 [Cyclobacteriaceae bacterium]
MKNQVKDIFLELISNRGFVNWHMDLNEGRSQYWDEWLHYYPQNKRDYFKAKKFLKIIRFKEGHFTGQESENKLFQILVSSGLNWESIVETRQENRERHFTEVDWIVAEKGRGRKSKNTLPDGSITHLNYKIN